MQRMIEIIPIGSSGDLFQICDGERYGRLDMENARAAWEVTVRGLQHWPEAVAELADWLERDGVLVGSPHPSHITWSEVVRRLTPRD